MTPITCLRVGIFSVLLLGLWPVVASTVLAQEGNPFNYRGTAGAYNIGFGVNPSNLSLGSIQIVVEVHDAITNEPVPDARVVIRATHTVKGTEGWATALNNPITPERYEARMEVNGPGTWSLSVDVSSPLGRVEIETLSVTIPEPRRTTSGSLVFLGASGVIIVGILYVTWSIKREQNRRREANVG